MTKNNIKQCLAFLFYSLASNQAKCLFLKNGLCIIRPNLIDMNPVHLKFYPFVISVDKYTRNCNNVLSLKICVPKEPKDINAKAFDMITNKNEAKAMTKLISCDCK